MRWFRVLPLIAALSVADAQTSAPTASARIAGVVRSAGLPIPGATVTATMGATRLVTATDELGQYAFDHVPAGHWTVNADMPAFTPVGRDVEVAGAPVAVDLNLAVAVAPPASGAPAGVNPRTATPSNRPRNASAAGAGAFRNLTLNQSIDAEAVAATQSTPAATTNTADANESFLISGTLDRGLQQSQQPDALRQAQAWDLQQQNPSLFGQ